MPCRMTLAIALDTSGLLAIPQGEPEADLTEDAVIDVTNWA